MGSGLASFPEVVYGWIEMSDKLKVPDGMLKAASDASDGFDPDGVILHLPLAAALGWLDNILHEGNVEFHRAILERGFARYPDTTAHITQRVAFEFGASFARNYIRQLFRQSDPR
jgi:hypothetical protein